MLLPLNDTQMCIDKHEASIQKSLLTGQPNKNMFNRPYKQCAYIYIGYYKTKVEKIYYRQEYVNCLEGAGLNLEIKYAIIVKS